MSSLQKYNFWEYDFAGWMKEVDLQTWALAGCSIHDLPDLPYNDWHYLNVTPQTAAKRAIKYQKQFGDWRIEL